MSRNNLPEDTHFVTRDRLTYKFKDTKIKLASSFKEFLEDGVNERQIFS
jgi:hypothetical protein